ncbi:MAG: nuclear transport factor 2 family protein [Pseudomonadota bacterium]
MAFEGPLEDRLAIRELVDTYNDAVARRDAAAWEATWAEDAVWDLLGHVVTGRHAIVATWRGAMDAFSYVGFVASPGAITVTGETATARFFVKETLVSAGDEAVRRVEGRYDDELQKKDGGWVFTKRAYQILHDQTTKA